MDTFLFFRYGIRMLYFFAYLIKQYKYWKQSKNTANIVLLSVNQIADIFSCKRCLIFQELKATSHLNFVS